MANNNKKYPSVLLKLFANNYHTIASKIVDYLNSESVVKFYYIYDNSDFGVACTEWLRKIPILIKLDKMLLFTCYGELCSGNHVCLDLKEDINKFKLFSAHLYYITNKPCNEINVV